LNKRQKLKAFSIDKSSKKGTQIHNIFSLFLCLDTSIKQKQKNSFSFLRKAKDSEQSPLLPQKGESQTAQTQVHLFKSS